MVFAEYADKGSLYAYLHAQKEHLDFDLILQWATDIANGRSHTEAQKKTHLVLLWFADKSPAETNLLFSNYFLDTMMPPRL